MPLYRYQCECGHQFERVVAIPFGALAQCPVCGCVAHRQIAACNFSFGWRLTDRAHDGTGPKEEVERDV